jgi:type II secretory pathway component PulF
MEFTFTARSIDGTTQAGVLDAESVAEVRKRLRQDGLFALTVAASATAKAVRRRDRSARPRGSGIRKSELLTLTSQLSIMSEAGVDLAESLQSVADRCRDAVLKKTLLAVHEDISSGIAVSEALRRRSNVFGEAYVASIAAGEASGTLTEVLKRLTDLLQNELRLRASLRGVLAYPLVLMSVSALVMTALVFFVLPQFADVFESLGEPPPVHTQLLLDSASFLRAHVWQIIVVMVAVICGIWRFGLDGGVVRYWDRAVLTSRLSGTAAQALLTGRSFRMLGLMLNSGIPLLEAIQLCRASVRNRVFAGLFDAMEHSVLNGGGIGEVVLVSPLIPSGAAQMVATAERAGRLGSVMVRVGEYYETDGERQLRSLVKLLEPAIIVVMGVVVACVVMAVILPLLEISTSSR